MARRTLSSIVVLVAVAAACQRSAPLTDAQRTAIADSIKQVDQQLFAALNARDVPKIMSFYVPGNDLISAEMGMIYPSRDSVDKAARAFYGTLKAANFVRDQQRIAVLAPTAAVMTETWHGTVTDSAGKSMDMKGAYTAVFERTADGWKIVAENNSAPMPMPQPAPAPARKRR
jgi:uncharacterized protein (TIGR02246 family)